MKIFERFMHQGGPEGGPSDNEGERVEKQEEEIKNTASFKEAVKAGRLAEAEAWLLDAFKNHENYKGNVDWLDHNSRLLFQGHRARKDWANAKRMISFSKDEDSRKGRIAKLEQESGMPFDQI